MKKIRSKIKDQKGSITLLASNNYANVHNNSSSGICKYKL